MENIRAFIAISLNEDLRSKIDANIIRLRYQTDLPVRWIPCKNIHLTVKFLGDVHPTLLNELIKTVADEVKQHPSFRMQVTGMGAFPSIRRPRVIWFGVNAPPEIQDLYLGIDGVCEKLGFESEGDKFSPHLTIGRVSANATPEGIQRISTWFTRNQIGVIGEMQIGTICLYRSDLHPGGAIYTLIEKFPLRS